MNTATTMLRRKKERRFGRRGPFVGEKAKKKRQAQGPFTTIEKGELNRLESDGSSVLRASRKMTCQQKAAECEAASDFDGDVAVLVNYSEVRRCLG